LELVPLRSGVVGGDSLNEERIPLASVRLEDKVLQLCNVVEPLRLSLSLIAFACLSLVNEPQSHILEEVLIVRNVDS